MSSLYTLDILTHTTFWVALFYAFQIRSGDAPIRSNRQNGAVILAVFTALMLGMFPPLWGTGGDRELYAYGFLKYVNEDISWSEVLFTGEWIFASYTKVTSFLGDPQYYFLLTAFIYVFNYYFVARRLAPQSIFLLTLAMFGAFMFRAYGVNTIRAGLALSFVLVGFTYYRKLVWSLLFFFIAFNIHHSTAIPIAAFMVAKYYNKPRFFYYFWFLCVALSAVAGGFFTSLFAAWGEDFDDRNAYLSTTDTHYNIGFRIDFILYSCLPLVLGHIYQERLHYRNEFYAILHSTYIIANAFWVLVIRANFSDRFAYLSWFMYTLVVMYPLLESPEHFRNVRNKVFWALLGINLFTYLMS